MKLPLVRKLLLRFEQSVAFKGLRPHLAEGRLQLVYRDVHWGVLACLGFQVFWHEPVRHRAGFAKYSALASWQRHLPKTLSNWHLTRPPRLVDKDPTTCLGDPNLLIEIPFAVQDLNPVITPSAATKLPARSIASSRGTFKLAVCRSVLP